MSKFRLKSISIQFAKHEQDRNLLTDIENYKNKNKIGYGKAIKTLTKKGLENEKE